MNNERYSSLKQSLGIRLRVLCLNKIYINIYTLEDCESRAIWETPCGDDVYGTGTGRQAFRRPRAVGGANRRPRVSSHSKNGEDSRVVDRQCAWCCRSVHHERGTVRCTLFQFDNTLEPTYSPTPAPTFSEISYTSYECRSSFVSGKWTSYTLCTSTI